MTLREWRNKAVEAIIRSKPYRWVLKKIVPFIRFTPYYPSLNGGQYHAGNIHLRPGDIILCIDKRKLTTMLIPGEFSHCALYVGSVGQSWKSFEVVDMTHENYRRCWFFDICKESDRVVILRCNDFDTAYINKLISKALSFCDAEYDVEFELGVKALYCSELIYEADFERRLQVSLEDLAGLGRPYISPMGLYRAKNVEIVFDSDEVR